MPSDLQAELFPELVGHGGRPRHPAHQHDFADLRHAPAPRLLNGPPGDGQRAIQEVSGQFLQLLPAQLHLGDRATEP